MRAVEINDQTQVPLAWLVTVSVFLATTGAGGVFWLSTMYSDLAQAKRDIVETKSDNREIVSTLRRLDRNMLKVQVKMGIRPEPNED